MLPHLLLSWLDELKDIRKKANANQQLNNSEKPGPTTVRSNITETDRRTDADAVVKEIQKMDSLSSV